MSLSKSIETLLEIYKERSKEQLETFLEETGAIISDEIIQIFDELNNLILISLCQCLYWAYSLKSERCLLLITQVTPVIIWLHYKSLVANVKEISCSVDALLLAIYNQVVNNQKLQKDAHLQVPNISVPSIYHKMLSGIDNTEVITPQPATSFKYLDKISVLNRTKVVHMVWLEFNKRISLCSESSIISCCNTIIRLSCSGFKFIPTVYTKGDIDVLQDYPRFKLDSMVVKDMVSSLYFIIYNGDSKLAYSALKCLHEKVSVIVCPESILATEALINLFELSQQSDGDFELMSPLNPLDFKKKFRQLLS
ncbi:hyccin 2 isoform X2 [Hydra vulgaris]|uniref:Hyccin 2 isoform X2 n=2 Tax=Hydra vulgaris TaxID=6087 RepID=A0ABM4C2X7_HYDVU